MRAVAAALGAVALLAAPANATVRLEQAATAQTPVAIAAPPGDLARTMIAQQTGEVRVLRDGRLLAAPFLDLNALALQSVVSPAAYSEQGLLGLAFAPDYGASGRFYVFYTARGDGALRVDEFRRGPSADTADPATRRAVIEIPHVGQSNHNGGQIAFGPDGYLYIGTGDGGGAGDPAENGQNLDSTTPPVLGGASHHPLLAKLLRIDPRSGATYAIPPGQPDFAGRSHRDEIWAYGLRNPFRFSFDRFKGDLYIGDVGQGDWEEIDFLPAPAGGRGANFGWDAFEGTHDFEGGAAALNGGPHVAPVIEKSHGDGWCSITGGYVVHDAALPELEGHYVYGDYCRGLVRAARVSTGGVTDDRDLGLAKVGSMSTFGEDACGRIYVASVDGAVFRLADSGACVPSSAPGPGAMPAPVAPVVDVDAPAVVLRVVAQRPQRSGRLRVLLTCDEQCDIVVRAQFTVRRGGGAAAARPLRAAGLRRTLAAGARVAFALRVGASTRRALARALRRRGRRVTATVTVVARDRAGNSRRVTARARLRR